MSQFLGFEPHLIPLGSTAADVHALLRSILTNAPTDPIPGYGWNLSYEHL